MLKCHRTAFWLALLSATAVDRASPVVTAEDAMISKVLASYSLPELEALGRAVIHQPPPLDEDSSASNNLPYMAQPFFMTVGVKLQAGYDYAGWRLCQRVIHEDASSLRQPFGEHCSLMWVENSAVNFSPVLGLSPPEYDFLKPGVHEAEAWFETGDISRNSSDNLSGNSSSSGPYRAWGRVTRLFEAGPPPLRDMHGAVIYLDDSTDTVDNSITSNIAHPDAIETQPSLGSPSVVGVIIEPRNHHPNLAYVIHNVATQLPAVRPMYVFHGPNFDPCRAAVESHGKVGSEAKASAALLCELVRTEQVLLHKLRVDNFTFRDYNRFVTSKAFWNRIGGDKVGVRKPLAYTLLIGSRKCHGNENELSSLFLKFSLNKNVLLRILRQQHFITMSMR